eukprot:TRINITY_DN26318_c1_g3_i1.p1 TRINITY_DN26318_c1_g3~~TRINITY_DN26318_c1_g3_i1.p1  ORF type:complete len:635 (+),score=75.25 TRINITY_DN26318_c1_g3_i1:100-1905(+)
MAGGLSASSPPPPAALRTPQSGRIQRLRTPQGSTMPMTPLSAPPPYVPRCAAVPEKFERWQKQAQKNLARMKEEQRSALDFHGFAGNIDGLRALLAHMHKGGSVRGWRTAIAPDEVGVQPVTFIEFCMGMKRIGYGGLAMTLWKELSKGSGGHHASLADLEPDLALHLDVVAKKWIKKYPGGAFEAWNDIRREHRGRCNYEEFFDFLIEAELLPGRKGPKVDVRRLFAALDMSGLNCVTKQDLHFLDHWAAKRLGATLPEEDIVPKEEAKPWEPPPVIPPKVPGLAEFREYLKLHYGTPARAWRMMIDVKVQGSVSPSEFGMACRQAGWKHPHGALWKELRDAGGGVACLRGLDPETCQAIELFNEAIGEKGVHTFWEELDPLHTGSISRTEFLSDTAEEYNLSAEEAALVFDCLDTQETGWITVCELGFLDAAAHSGALDGGLQGGRANAGMSQSQSFISTVHSVASSKSEPTLRATRPSLSGASMTGSMKPSSPEKSLTQTTFASAPSDKGPVWRHTRSIGRIGYLSSHLLKHRWLASESVHRHLYSSREVPPTEKLPWTKERDIFRSSSEFYREGVKLLASRRDPSSSRRPQSAESDD